MSGAGGTWENPGTGDSIQYVCYAFATSGLASSCPPARPPEPIGVSTVYGSFFANPNNNGTFDVTRGTAPVFTEQFATIDFNPPTSAQVECSNNLGLGADPTQTRPMVDVIPLSNGSCTTQTLQGNGY